MKSLTLIFALVISLPLSGLASAEQQAPLQNIAQVYQLMLKTVTDYPTDIRDLARHFPPSDGGQIERHNKSRSIIDLPDISDPWRGSYSVRTGGNAALFSMISCERIGQKTLSYMQDYFDNNRDVETLTPTERSQLFLVEQLAAVPKNAVAMQVCHLHYPLPSSATEQEEYETLLSEIGDDFIDTQSAAKRLQLTKEYPDRFITYFFDGTGNLFLDNAVVWSLNATVNEKAKDGKHIQIQLIAVSYLLASLS